MIDYDEEIERQQSIIKAANSEILRARKARDGRIEAAWEGYQNATRCTTPFTSLPESSNRAELSREVLRSMLTFVDDYDEKRKAVQVNE